jgi:PKD repeat protein
MPLVYDDKMYLMGGNHDGTRMNDIWTSTDGNVWTQIPTTTVWAPRELGGAGYIGPAMYVWGGLSSTDYLTDTWESDNKGVTWYKTNTTGFGGRYGFNGVSVDSRIMFGAGTNATSTVPNFLLSTNGTIWTETNSSIVPFDRYYTSTVAVNNSGIVMVGGYNATSGFLNDVWVSGEIPPTTYPITADFSSFNTAGSAPFTTYLYDTSTNLIGSETFGWDFGEGNTSTEKNVYYTWNATGEYTVNHSVSNGVTTSYSQQNVTVGTATLAPVASFYGSPTTGNVPLTVSFTDVSSNTPTSWNWSFGDGIYSELQNPSHAYTRSGFRTVNLTATNSAGSNITVRSKFVRVN